MRFNLISVLLVQMLSVFSFAKDGSTQAVPVIELEATNNAPASGDAVIITATGRTWL